MLFLNSGMQNRAGPQRIYVQAARRFAEAGIASLRVDLPGIGDSDGAIERPHFDIFDPAHVGAALDVLQADGPDRVILLGLCSGARLAVRSAVGDSRVAAVAAWSMPVVSPLPGMPTAANIPIHDGTARDMLRDAASQALQPSTWRRLATAPDSRRRATRRVTSALRWSIPIFGGVRAHQTAFTEALDALLADKRPALFAYGEQDAVPRGEFERDHDDVVRGLVDAKSCAMIPRGDHTFTSSRSRATVIEQTLAWIERTFEDAPEA